MGQYRRVYKVRQVESNSMMFSAARLQSYRCIVSKICISNNVHTYLDVVNFSVRGVDRLGLPVEERPVQEDEQPPISEMEHQLMWRGCGSTLDSDLELWRQSPFPGIQFEAVARTH